MLKVAVFHDESGRAAVEPLRRIAELPDAIPKPQIEFRPAPEGSSADYHVAVFATHATDPKKVAARAWLASRTDPRLPKLPAIFAGPYRSPFPATEAPWHEISRESIPAEPREAWFSLVNDFAAKAHPRVVVVDDDEQDRLRHVPTPTVRRGESSVWTVAVRYGNSFSARHTEPGVLLRRLLKELTRSDESSAVRVLLDVKLGRDGGAFDECRALAYELLHGDPRCLVHLFSDHGEQPVYLRSLAILERLFPKRLFSPRASWMGSSFLQFLPGLEHDHESVPFNHASVHPVEGDLAVAIEPASAEHALKLGATSWLGDDFAWKLVGASSRPGGGLEAIFRPAATTAPDVARYREFLPRLLPVDYLADWHAHRLGAAVEAWHPAGDPPATLLAHRPLYAGPRKNVVTAAMYFDGDNLLKSWQHAQVEQALKQVFHQWCASRKAAVPKGYSFKTWVCLVANMNNATEIIKKGTTSPSRMLPGLIAMIREEATACGLFSDPDPDLDFLQIHIVPDLPKQGTDTALKRLWKADGDVDYKLLLTNDAAFGHEVFWEGDSSREITFLKQVRSTLDKDPKRSKLLFRVLGDDLNLVSPAPRS